MNQQNLRTSQRKKQLVSCVNSKLHQQDKSTTPSILQRQQQITPKRKQQFSLPRFNSTNNYLQQPMTREDMLKFLEQITFAVENVQYILLQSDDVQNQMTQNVGQSQNKFKITQEQQTDYSFIQQQLKTKLQPQNQKTQTPNRTQSFYQDNELKKLNIRKQKTEFSGESDTTEKQSSKLPIISQSSKIKQKNYRIMPDGTKNRIQSQVFQYQYYQNQKDNQEKSFQFISKLHSESQSEYSNNLNESSQKIRIKTEQSDNCQIAITPKQLIISQDTENEKKQKTILLKEQSQRSQKTKTNDHVSNINISQEQQKSVSIMIQTQDEPVNKVLNQDFVDSKIKDNNQKISKKLDQSQNIEITQKTKKRPIQVKQSILLNNEEHQTHKNKLSKNSAKIDSSQQHYQQSEKVSKIEEINLIDTPDNQIVNSQIKDEKCLQTSEKQKDDKIFEDKKKYQQINSLIQIHADQEQTHQIQETQNPDPIISQQNLFIESNNQSLKNNKTIDNEEFYFEPEEESKMISKLQPKISKGQKQQENQQELMNKTSSTIKSVYILNENIEQKDNFQLHQQAVNKSNLNNIYEEDNQNDHNKDSQNQFIKTNSANEIQNQKTDQKLKKINQFNNNQEDFVKSQIVYQNTEMNYNIQKSLQQSQIQISTDNHFNKQLKDQKNKETENTKIQNNSLKNSIKESQNLEQNYQGNHEIELNQSQNIKDRKYQEMSEQYQLDDQNSLINKSQEQLKQKKSSLIQQIQELENQLDIQQKNVNLNKSSEQSNRQVVQQQMSKVSNEIKELDTDLKSKI
ncbi:unnamed protein product [Paramecium sonneborni]|uniref:Uncharacterized protein n=1 Tax=Paramecium sonneborni TaxID=65129 RepID=A0A8S1PBM2_9CILI|nr:unnamed protein product [Paramecium sonneborni]